VRYRHDLVNQQTQRQKSGLTVTLAVVLGRQSETAKDPVRIGEIYPVFLAIAAPFRLVPREHEEW
jgi:hypothetical protein